MGQEDNNLVRTLDDSSMAILQFSKSIVKAAAHISAIP
jgi:hypothetical protein